MNYTERMDKARKADGTFIRNGLDRAETSSAAGRQNRRWALLNWALMNQTNRGLVSLLISLIRATR